jgi:methionyl-tRNA formyltransferase
VPGAILAGDAETGVTVMRLDAKMDAGPILAQRRVLLPPDARAKAFTEELFELGARLLVETLAPYAEGQVEPISQDDSQATYTALLKKTDGAIDWGAPAERIERMTRAYDPWPGAWTSWRGQPLKIITARVHAEWAGDTATGALLDRKDGVWAATGAGALELLLVQPAGRRALAAAEWRRGLHDIAGARLGE